MGLSSVMNTALSGMNAAMTMVDVSADNLTNADTPGFKGTSVQFGTLTPQTLSLGAPIVTGNAGADPMQVGQGVMVAGITRDFSQGSIATSDQLPLLALDGEGLFILQGHGGQRLYTRDGNFSLNSNGELVTAQGDKVLGFMADAQGNIDSSQLAPITIRIGSLAQGVGGTLANLQSYSVSTDGTITGHYSDGVPRALGQLRIARFANQAGLAATAGNTFEATSASGLPIESNPGENGAGQTIQGATELSNVDIGHELIELTLAGNMFQANWQVFQTANNLLGELFFPYRWQ
jgi:flagellar hook protein FlgE